MSSPEPLDDLVPPPDLLFDGSASTADFKKVGDGFTYHYVVGRARLRPNDRVLDVGCGIGQKARPLAGLLGPDGSYEGFDIVKAGIDWCAQKYARFPRFRFQHVDIFNRHYNPEGRVAGREFRFPYPDGDFDLVLLSSVFTHMLPADVPHYMSEIARVLKPGGRAVITFFLLNPEAQAFQDAGGGPIQVPHSYDVHCRVAFPETPETTVAYDEDFARALLLERGFHVAELNYGYWNGRKELFGALQDVVIAVRA